MSATRRPLRIAIGQINMQWTGDANTAAILQAIETAATAQAKLCVFPELAVTGFHRQIAAMAKPDRVQRWMESVQDACAKHSIAVAVGAPSFGDDGLIYNSQVFVDESGQCLGVVEKHGLTDPEATFFARGRFRPVVELQGQRCTAVICREIEDLNDVCAQLCDVPPDIIFWPGLMSTAKETAGADPPVHVQQAQRLARRTGAFVIQANWPNSLNYPELSAQTGQSVVIDPAGEIVLTLPKAQAGLAIFTLEEPWCRWIAQEDVSPPAVEGVER